MESFSKEEQEVEVEALNMFNILIHSRLSGLTREVPPLLKLVVGLRLESGGDGANC